MTVRCCKECKDRRVTENYNCHSHCDRYLAETIAHEREKRQVKREREKEIIANDIYFRHW